MKSIKEKAEEYTSDITNPVTNCAAFLAYKRGANYVLGEIEELLSLKKQYADKDRLIDDLEWRISQLKK